MTRTPPNKKAERLSGDEALFKTLVDNMLDAVLIMDWDGSIVFANKASLGLVELVDRTSAEGLSVMDFIHPDYIAVAVRDLELVRAEKGGFLSEYKIRTLTGKDKWVEGLGKKVYLGERDLDLVILRDITRRIKAEELLRQSEEKFRTLAETTAAAIFMCKGEKIFYSNPGMETLTGYSGSELAGKLFYELVHPDHREFVTERLARLQESKGAPSHYEVKLISQNGDDRWIDLSASYIEIDKKPACIGTAHDITDRKKAEQIILRLAYFDTLTGLPNRLLFNDRLKVLMSRAERSHDKIAVIMLDLDKFKDINDSLGHSVGDELLKTVAQRISATLRKSDTVARMGGDEFLIAVSDVKEPTDVLLLAEKIITALSEKFISGRHEMRITSSLGLAFYPDDGREVDILVKNADIAMYAAKHSGGNGFQTYAQLPPSESELPVTINIRHK